MSRHANILGRVEITYKIEPKEFIHVGAGENVELITSASSVPLQLSDRPVIKLRDDRPYLPGTSLKGLFRSRTLRLLNSLKYHQERLMKDLTPSQSTGIFSTQMDEAFHEMFSILTTHPILTNRHVNNQFSKARSRKKKREISHEIGLIDRIFGLSGLASLITFHDALPTEDVPHIMRRRHVKIDSTRDRAQSRKLFDVEGVTSSQKFTGKITFIISDDEFYRPTNQVFYHLIWMPLMRDDVEILIGGQKTRGYGLAKLTPLEGAFYSLENMALNEKPTTFQIPDKAEQLKSYLPS